MNYLVSLTCFSLFIAMHSAAGQTADASSDAFERLSSKRIAVVSEFFELIQSDRVPDEETEQRLFGSLQGVRACLRQTASYRSSATPVSSFVKKAVAPLFGNDHSFKVLIFGPTGTVKREGMMDEDKNAIIAFANLTPNMASPAMVVVFFSFAPDSDELFVAPVFVRSESSTSLYDMALMEKGDQ